MNSSSAARELTRNAAIVMAIGLLTGVFVAAAMTKQVNADAHAALASHLNAVLGCFWMVSVAYSMPMLRYGETGLRRLGWLTTIPNVGNWIITALKAVLHVSGVAATGESKNDLVFGLSTVFVVVPSFAAVGAWIYGFFGKR